MSIIRTSENMDAQALMYTKPWARMGAYFVGAIFGLSYFEYKSKEKYEDLSETLSSTIYEKLKNSQMVSVIVAAVGIGLTALYVFPKGQYYSEWVGFINGNKSYNCWHIFPSFLYNLTSRPFFVLGLGLILLPTLVGRLRIIRCFLSGDLFVVLARLNYMVYMVHVLVLFWYFFFFNF